MDRREALKGIGLSLGYLIGTPAVISLLQSCSNEPKTSWEPVFFNEEQSSVLQKLVDLILPATEKYPGAAELGIPRFIDLYFKKVSDKKEQESFRKGFSLITKELINASDKDYHRLLTKYLKATPEETISFKNDDESIYHLLTDLRKITIWAYKATEQVGEKILSYDPIPGKYKACISLEEATGGKAWSL